MKDKKPKSFLERQTEKFIDLQSKVFELEHKNRLKDDYDNCLLCNHATVKDNEMAKIFFALDLKWIGNCLNFPVVTCKLYNDKYVANPMKRPGWCKRK
jgi:hypothetical protein